MTDGFQRTLDHIRSIADSEAEKGRLFERLMKTYFVKDPLYKERFSEVWLWSEWADLRPDFEGTDTGIDLVAEERQGGYCAIQCKCRLRRRPRAGASAPPWPQSQLLAGRRAGHAGLRAAPRGTAAVRNRVGVVGMEPRSGPLGRPLFRRCTALSPARSPL